MAQLYVREYLARPEGFEPPAPRFVVWCSIQLSYGRAGDGDIGVRIAARNPAPRRPGGDCRRLQNDLERRASKVNRGDSQVG